MIVSGPRHVRNVWSVVLGASYGERMSGCMLSPKSVARVNREHGTQFFYMATIGGDPSWCRATGVGMLGTCVHFNRRTGEVYDPRDSHWAYRAPASWRQEPHPDWMFT